MTKVRLTLGYSGTHFSGFQIQPNARTVAGVLESALERIYKGKVRVVGSGRTDAGVHAIGQVVAFEAPSDIEVERIPVAINANLPSDVNVTSACIVPDNFHPIQDAVFREYQYLLSPNQVPFQYQDRIVTLPCVWDDGVFDELGKTLLGTHDFKNLSCTGSEVGSTVRTLHRFSATHMSLDPLYSEAEPLDLIRINIGGNSFLYKMVRNIIGIMFEIFARRVTIGDLADLLESETKHLHYKTAPAHGLCLVKVNY